jgi:hypothetical protein
MHTWMSRAMASDSEPRTHHSIDSNERHTMKRIALACAIVAAAIAAAAFATTGSAQSRAATSLHLISTTQESIGFAPEHHRLRPGDRVGTGDAITGDDTGIDRVICTVIDKDHAMCTAVAQLSKGTLTAESLASPEPGETHYAITGGTGAYQGASGTAVVTDIPGTAKADVQITLLP